MAGAALALAVGLCGCGSLSEPSPSTAVSFRISGRVVTLASHNAGLLAQLQAKHLYVDCTTAVTDDRDEPGTEVGAPLRWPARATETQVTVPVRLAVTDADSTYCQLTTVPASDGNADDPDPPIAGNNATVTSAPPAPKRRAVQPVGLPGVRFSLDGRVLRVSVKGSGRLLGVVRGRKIDAMCVSGEATRQALTNQTGPGFYAVVASREVVWGRRAYGVALTLPFDLSATVDDCWLQDPAAAQDVSYDVPPGNIAEAGFTAAGRESIQNQIAPTRWSNIERLLRKAETVARGLVAGQAVPSSPARLADGLARSKGLLGVILVYHVPSMQGVVVPGAIYVVGSDPHGVVRLAALTDTLRLCVVTTGS